MVAITSPQVETIHQAVLHERLQGLRRTKQNDLGPGRRRTRVLRFYDGVRGWVSPWGAYLNFVGNGLSHLFFSFNSIQSIVIAPLSYLYAVFLYCILFIAMAIATVVLGTASSLGLTDAIQQAIIENTAGLTMINAVAPSMFGRRSKIKVDAARIKMPRGPLYEEHEDELESTPVRIIDLDIVMTCLLMSAILYCRVHSKFIKAAQVVSKDSAEASELLKEAEERILAQAAFWNLHFLGIADFRIQGGSFAGIFYDEANKWMVLAFKGTDPSDSYEFLVDAKVSKTDGRRYLWGELHEGFYEQLFPDAVDADSERAETRPYAQILRCISDIASGLRGPAEQANRPPRIPLYVTGHSLGAALASIIYTRFLKSPEDLGQDVILADLHAFGTPLTGDNDYYMEVEGCLIDRSRYNLNVDSGTVGHPHPDIFSPDASNIVRSDQDGVQATFVGSRMWRWTDRYDIVAQVPPGIAAERHYGERLSKTNLLNYAAVGTEFVVGLNKRKSRMNVRRRVDASSDHVRILASTPSVASQSTPIVLPLGRLLLVLLTPFIGDHFPAMYYERLDQVQTGQI